MGNDRPEPRLATAPIRRSGRRLADYKFSLLLLTLFLFLAVNPFFADKPGWTFMFDALLLLVLLGNVYAVTHRPRSLIAGGLLAGGAFLSFVYADIGSNQPFEVLGFLLLGLLWLFSTGSLLGHILSRHTVTVDTLAGSVCVYLQLALVWSIVFYFIETLIPGSFNFVAEPLTGAERSRDHFEQFTYYSFVTLTTLGYGDVLAVSAPARNLSFLEAAVGQIYLAVLVARLLGLHLAGRENKET